MPSGQIINGRYEINGPPIGQGGMGVVYKAYDFVTKRFIALKTLSDSVDPAVLELFEKEWTVLAGLSHPNIVDILDSGKFLQDDQQKPYFVMPLLRGNPLDHLIKDSSHRLTVERAIEIICQTCRGLQAAHEQGLVHRDLKPSNIFVMDDDTVKIIDFGVVHLANVRSGTGIKGTLQYMAPEQLEMKSATPFSDIFSLGVVSYETLTGRKPFVRKTETETAEAVRTCVPPPVSDFNSAANNLLSRTVHKAMAKQPWHRFSNAREFAETLQRALRNEPIERFDRARIQPRLERIKKAYGESDYQFAAEILTELEAEGNIDPEMTALRSQIEQATRQKTIRKLLESARTRLEEEEYPLALQKIQEVLEIDPRHVDALSMKSQIEKHRSEKQIENWFRLVREHLDNQLFRQARQGLQEILQISPSNTHARVLLAEVDRREQEINKMREEKERLYQSALQSYHSGEISTALSKLERVLELVRLPGKTPTPERDAQYESLYNQIRSERDASRSAYAEGRRHLDGRNFTKVLEICEEFLKKTTSDPLFQALKLEAEERQRQQQSAAIAEIGKHVESEADLERKVNILKEAVEQYPDEPHFRQLLKVIRDRRDLVASIVNKAHQYEERGQFNDALSQWDILRNIYNQYPGLEFELQRLGRRREEQAKEEAKGHWVEQIDHLLESGDYARAEELVHSATAEFPDDRELAGLARLANQGVKRSAEALQLLETGRELCQNGNSSEGLKVLKQAEELDPRNPVLRSTLVAGLLEEAKHSVDRSWKDAEPLIQQVLELDATNQFAKNLQALVQNNKRQDSIRHLIYEARELQAAGDIHNALLKVEQGLKSYPIEARLLQLQATLRNSLRQEPRANPIRARLETAHTQVAPEAALPHATASETGAPQRVEGAPSESRENAPVHVPLPTKVLRRLNLSAAKDSGIRDIQRIFARTKSVRFSPFHWVAIGVAVILIVSAIAVTKLGRKRETAALPIQTEKLVQQNPIELEANVPSARFIVDGKAVTSPQMSLTPGEHKAEAVLEGYKPDSQSFYVDANAKDRLKVQFHLESILPELRFSSDLKAGRISLDGGAFSNLQDGTYLSPGISTGEHVIRVLDGNREVLTVPFKVQPGELVSLTSRLKTNNTLSAVFISTLGNRAKVYTNSTLTGGLLNQPAQPVSPEGLELKDIGPANNQLILDDRTGRQQLTLETNDVPVISIKLGGNTSKGTLVVQSNVPNAFLVVDGVTLRRPLVNGTKLVNLDAKKYSVQLSREGYQNSAEQVVEVRKGQTQSLKIDLAPEAQQSSLTIETLPSGTEVFIDGSRQSSVVPNGSFSTELAAGTHVILLKRHGYEDIRIEKELSESQSLRISPSNISWKQLGWLSFRIGNPEARIAYRRRTEEQSRQAQNNQIIPLPAGNYEVSVQAEKFSPRSQTILVVPGRTTPVEWTLTPLETNSAVAAPEKTNELFLDSKNWELNDGWWVHDSSGYGWLRSNQGTLEVDILKQFGLFNRLKRVEWVCDYGDESNKITYWLDESALHRKQIVKGEPQREVRIGHDTKSSNRYHVQISVTPAAIVIRDGNGRTLDELKRATPGKPLGRTGFKGRVAILATSFK